MADIIQFSRYHELSVYGQPVIYDRLKKVFMANVEGQEREMTQTEMYYTLHWLYEKGKNN